MVKSNDIGYGCDGDSFQELKRKVEEQCGYDETESLKKLTLVILQGFVNRVVTKSADNLIDKEKKHKTRDNGKKKESVDNLIEKEKKSKTRDDGKKKESADNLINKKKEHETRDNGKKKQKTNDINKEKKPRDNQKDTMKFFKMGLEPPPDMPQEFKRCVQNLGGTEIKLIIQRFIQVTDLKSSQNRFPMSLNKVRSDEFLNEYEKEKLNKREPIEVTFVQPCGEVSTLNLNKWEIGSSWSYVLIGAWYKNVVKNSRNNLKPTAVVQIWSFRVEQTSKLGFVMIKVTDGGDGEEEV